MKRAKKPKTIQHTIRSVPDFVDKALRARAKHDLVLFSRDRYFDRIPHLARC